MGLKYLNSIFILIFSSCCAFAQINADFTTVNSTNGCSPLSVVFKDQSTGTITFRKWIFGNGNSTSSGNQTMPSAIYGIPGSYTVTLIVSDGMDYDTIIKPDFITVYHDPIADFTTTSPNSGCNPLDVTFQDNSSATDGALAYWNWDFGDGTNSNSPNPVHTFLLPGSFPISLHVIDIHGCYSTKLLTNYINVSETPVPDFSVSQSTQCFTPFIVDFTNESTSAGNLTFSWDFGDSGTSTLENPSHTFNDFDSYDITLIANDENGCSDTVIKPGFITVDFVVADFTTNKNFYCIDEKAFFTNNSSGSTKYFWDFGDGHTDTVENPFHEYDTYGDYTIKLIAFIENSPCSDTITKTITVERIEAGFSASPTRACEIPITVDYSDESINAVSWNWHFGKHYLSGLQNPSILYDFPGVFRDTLIVTSLHGCKDTAIVDSSVVITIPAVAISASKDEGCAPLDVNFQDVSYYDSGFDAINSRFWNFGDGITSTAPTHSQTFTTIGDHFITLTITTVLGCTYTDTLDVKTGTLQNPDFTVSTNESCASDKVYFFDNSTDTNLINSWYWVFIADTLESHLRNPEVYFPDTGYFSVNYDVAYNGCHSYIERDSVIYIKGPVGKFAIGLDCSTPLFYNFTSDFIDAEKFVWDFGDGEKDSIHVNTSHTYASGEYTTYVHLSNSTTGCTFDTLGNVFPRDLKASFYTDITYGCPGLTINFYPDSTQDETSFFYANYLRQYLWYYDDGSTFYSNHGPYEFTTFPASHIFNQEGTFNTRLIVEDLNGCRDSVSKTIKIYKPAPNFSTPVTAGCKPFNVNFTDITPYDTTIASWHWDFGNGDTSNIQNPSAVYNYTGTYSVALFVTDILGCSGSITKNNYIAVLGSKPKFTSLDSTLCMNDSAYFVNNTAGTDLNFLWDFGDGFTSTEVNPVHFYIDTGSFDVSLQVIDTVGCDTTAIKVQYMKKQSYPVADFIADTLNADCYPLIVSFTDDSNSPYASAWQWNFGDEGTSTLFDPIHSFSKPGNFDVSLVVTTSFGCSDSVTKPNFVDVNGPYAEFSFITPDVCAGEPVAFYIDTMVDVDVFSWDFGDGIVVPGTGDTIYHTYSPDDYGILYPQLKFSDADSTCPKFDRDSINISLVVSIFDIGDSVLCSGSGLSFVNYSFGETFYDWDFGDGNHAFIENPVHSYTTPGDYVVSLTAMNIYGCLDVDTMQVTINPLPGFTDIPDTAKCSYDTITLDAGVGYAGYLWNDNSTNQTLSVAHQGQYTVKVSNPEGCWSAKDTIFITDIPVPLAVLGNDTVICDGSTLMLVASINYFYSYQWSTGSTFFAIDAVPDSTYYLTITDVCGTSDDSIHIGKILSPSVNLGADTAICVGSSLTLYATGSQYDSYLWNNNSTADTLVADTVNTYSVLVSNVCAEASDSIAIDLIPIPAIILTDDTICEGTTLTLNAPFSIYHQYLWNTGEITDTITAYPDSTYWVEITSACGDAGDTVFIEKIPLPMANLGVDTAICVGSSLTLYATGSQYDSYLWGDNSTADTLVADTVQTYFVTVSNICTTASDSVAIDLIPIPAIILTDDTICEGTTLTLNVPFSMYHQYLWNTGEITDSITAYPDSTYWVEITSACGDAGDTVFIEKISLPIANLGVDTAICTGTSLTLYATGSQYDSYLWGDNSTADTLVADTVQTYFVTVSNVCTTVIDSITIDLILYPSVFLGNDTSICESSSIILHTYPSIYDTITWNNGSVADTLVADSANTYSVVMSNVCGTATDTITVGITLFPVVDLGVDTAICDGLSLTLDAGSGFDLYLWSTGDTVQQITVDTVGAYIVEIDNKCGIDVDTLNFDIIPIPDVHLGNDTSICEGTTLELDPGGSIYNTYLWNNDSTVQIQIVDTISLFSVTVTNVCGESYDSINIGLKPNPHISLGNDTTFCENSTIAINWVSGYADYYWDSILVLQSVNVTVTDTVSLMVRDSVGCFSNTDTIIVTAVSPAVVNLGSDTTICYGDSLLLTANSNYDSYQWNTGSANDSIYASQSGDYFVEVKNACNAASDTLKLTVYNVTIDLGLDTVLCPSEIITLDAGEGFTSYLWSDGSGGQTLTVSQTGTYYVSVTNMCAFKSDTVEVYYLPNSVDLGPDTAVCEGDIVSFSTANEFVNYTWHNGFHYPVFTTSRPGTYYLTVENKCGVFSDTVTLSVKPIPFVDLGPDVAVSWGTEVIDAGNEADSYLWSTGDTTHAIEVTPGNYTVWVEITKDGCIASDTVLVINAPYDSGCMVDVPNAFTPNGDGKNDVLHVRGYCIQDIEFMVFNRFGEMVFKSEDVNTGWDGTYKGRLQESEVYIWYLKVTMTDGQVIEKTGNVALLN